MSIELVGLYIFAYVAGTVPTAYLIARLVKRVDIRNYGSGNVGGSNLFYHVGKRWVVVLGVFDVLVKGSTPIWVGRYVLGLELSLGLAAASLLAVIGHNWSPYLKFQGGRGISVIAGSLLALSPLLLTVFIAVSVAGWAVTRASGVWVLISLALLPLWAVLLPQWGLPGNDQYVISWYCVGLLVLVVIKRLLSNWTPLYEGLPKKKVILNRLFLDRDVDSHTDWVRRTPQEIE